MSARSFLRLPLLACIVAGSTCLAVVQASTQRSIGSATTWMDIPDDTWTNRVCPYLENNNTPLHEVFDSLLNDRATPEWVATPEEYRPLVLPGRARGPLAEQMRTELAAFLAEESWESRSSSTRRQGQENLLTDRVKEAAKKFALHLMEKSRKRFIQLLMLDSDAPRPLLALRSVSRRFRSTTPVPPMAFGFAQQLLSYRTTTSEQSVATPTTGAITPSVQQFIQNGGEHQPTGTRIAATSIISDYVGPLDESFQYFLRRLEAVLKRPDLQSAEMATDRTLVNTVSSYNVQAPRLGADLLPSAAKAYYSYDRRIATKPTPHFRLLVEAGGPGVDLSNEAKEKLAWDTKWQWHAVVRDADSGQHRTIVPAPGEEPNTWADRTANAIYLAKTRRVILPDAPELFVCGSITGSPMMNKLSLVISEAFDGKLCTE
ncbi:unnamed protein product [Amoebophrya sp. A120]|nr:unnamed protein product [Amoebophrya sp. A120]|eukprot:GSA120T00020419001.1